MDPNLSAQDVLRCHVCETPVPPYYCDSCRFNLCTACVGIHLSDQSKEHKVMQIKQLWAPLSNYSACSKHTTRQCELFCKDCDIAICAQCISTEEHEKHYIVDILKMFQTKKEELKRDLHEIKNSIHPIHQKVASDIPLLISNVRKEYKELQIPLQKQGEIWHNEIDHLIQSLQAKIENRESRHRAYLEKKKDEIDQRIAEILQIIQDLDNIVTSNDVTLVSEYKSRINEFRHLPPPPIVNLPIFSPEKIDKARLYRQFGSLMDPTIPDVPESPFLDTLQIITSIDTDFSSVFNVSCLGDDKIWTRGLDAIINLYHLNGELIKSVPTTSGNWPYDIAVTRTGHLFYTDYRGSSVMAVSHAGTHFVECFLSDHSEEWKPRGLCFTASDELLLVMVHLQQPPRIVRYSPGGKRQIIQWEEKDRPLFNSNNIKYLCENRNLDICVADANAVVVVTSAGKFPISPVGICTDSRALILVAASSNVHVLDKNGAFLRYFSFTDSPLGLCVDSKDNLFVSFKDNGTVQKVRYYK